MRLAFVATEAGFETTECALICGAAGGGQYLAFQRDSEDTGEDWGIHLEYGDQANGGYGCVAVCRLARTALTVDLSQQLGNLSGVTGFDVALDIDDQSFESLRGGLQRVFRGYADTLRLD